MINGFGRIGRAIARINLMREVFELVSINDINPDNKNLAYLLKYDSTFGKLDYEVYSDSEGLIICGKRVRVFHENNINCVDMSDIDVVIESSGIKNNILQVEEMEDESEVERFIITNVDSAKAQNILFGVNEDILKDKSKKIISSSICDVVSLAPVYKLLVDNYGIENGFLTTLHPWLSYQNLLDGPAKSWSQPGDVYSHYALGRSSVMSVIPKSTSAIRALSNVYPEAFDKIRSFSYRIPTSLVSTAVLVTTLCKDVTVEEIVSKFEEEEQKQKWDVYYTTDEPMISVDYIGNSYSVIIDTRWIQVVNGNHIEIVYWYDNEWGYSSKIVDIVKYISDME